MNSVPMSFLENISLILYQMMEETESMARMKRSVTLRQELYREILMSFVGRTEFCLEVLSIRMADILYKEQYTKALKEETLVFETKTRDSQTHIV